MRSRNNRIRFRLNDAEYEKLCQLVSKSGLSRESYLRQIIAGLQPRNQPPPDYHPMMRQLYYCGNSLNQIARKAHALNAIDVQKYDDAVRDFKDAVAQIERAVIEPERIPRGSHKDMGG